MGFAAFIAQCASIISKFAASFWRTLIKKPADWHVITLGDILSILVYLVGIWIFFRYMINVWDKYNLRAESLIKSSRDQLQISHDQTEKFTAIAEKVYGLLEEVRGRYEKKEPPSID
jgi:hypothetical protein